MHVTRQHPSTFKELWHAFELDLANIKQNVIDGPVQYSSNVFRSHVPHKQSRELLYFLHILSVFCSVHEALQTKQTTIQLHSSMCTGL